MANLVITSTAYTVKVEFNDFSEDVGYNSVNYRRQDISEVLIKYNSNYVTIIMCRGKDFDVSYNEYKHALIIDSIDGVVPTDNNHLLELIESLQQV